jgi:hypothetical protein
MQMTSNANDLAYRKSAAEPRLVLTRSRVSHIVASSAAIDELRAQAFRAAANKARQLGWIGLPHLVAA